MLAADRDYSLGEEARIRSSQCKIHFDSSKPLDPAHMILDVLSTNSLRSPVRISAEVIRALEDNGVPATVFKDLLELQIKEIFNTLTHWADPEFSVGNEPLEMLMELYAAVEKSGGVNAARKARRLGGEARFRGFSEKRPDEVEDVVNVDVLDSDIQTGSAAWWPDYVSGLPSSLAETAMAMLDSGE